MCMCLEKTWKGPNLPYMDYSESLQKQEVKAKVEFKLPPGVLAYFSQTHAKLLSKVRETVLGDH